MNAASPCLLLAAAVVRPLRKTDAMNRLCRNCHFPLPRYGQYCSHCGQQYTDGRVTVGELMRDFFVNVLNLDNKLWRTWRALLSPGKLTRHYFQGKQVRYVAPLRLFFIMALVFFAVLGIAGLDQLEGGIAENIRENERDHYYGAFLDRLRRGKDSIAQAFPHAEEGLDSLYGRLHAGYGDSTSIGMDLEFGKEWELDALRVAEKDLATYSTDSLLNLYQVDDFWQRLHIRQYLRITREGTNFTSFILGKMVWMLLLLMPALALVLKLLYIRRRRYFVEHLIYLFHTHAFAFLALSLLILFDHYFEGPTFLTLLYLLTFGGLYVYFFVAQKRVYQQGWMKTWVKYTLLQSFYFFLLIFFVIFTFVVTALIY